MKKKRLSKKAKLLFILENELKMTMAVLNGHRPSQDDEFQEIRELLRKYRLQLGLIKKTNIK